MTDDTKTFDDPHGKLKNAVDDIFGSEPVELKKVKDNLDFIKTIKNNPVNPGIGAVKAFGVEVVDVNAILKDKIWDRSIFTVDKLCKMFLKATLEQKKKYLAKKRALEFNYVWLILLIIGVPVALLILIFLLPRLGVI